jgi:hypothetical protein
LLFSQLLLPLVEIFIYENPSTVSSIARDAQNIDIYQNLCSDTLGALILKHLFGVNYEYLMIKANI